MTSVRIPLDVQATVAQRAGFRCEYCRSDEWLTGIPCEIDHIFPRAAGGETILDNLALACSHCNRHKSSRTQAVDPATQTMTPLFHPRSHRWRDHFAWSDDGVAIIGLTGVGRATLEVLQMNHPRLVAARTQWAIIGRHPPLD